MDLLRISPSKATHHLLLLVILTIFTTFSHPLSSPTVHDLLKKKGLPSGLLPKEIKSFEFNNTNGLLEVFLDSPCLAKFENRVFFESVVRANLSYGQLFGVQGLSQEELFIWFPVKEIAVNDPKSGLILFDIGMAQKQFSLSLFEEPPSCNPKEGFISKSGRKEKGTGVQR